MRSIPGEMHACEMHSHETHAHKMHTREIIIIYYLIILHRATKSYGKLPKLYYSIVWPKEVICFRTSPRPLLYTLKKPQLSLF
jgi:hypothetical protein